MIRAGDIAGNLIGPETPLLQTIERMDSVRRKLLLVIDPDGRLLGTVSDGDIRRGLMRRLTMDAAVREVMNAAPVALRTESSDAENIQRLSERGVGIAPVLDHHDRVVGLYPDAVGASSARDNLVVIMAGGRGVRLAPLTQTCPKPMLKVAGRPLLETIIERLHAQGFSRFRLAVNYLAEVITDHFGDGSAMGVEIEYLREDHPRGTAGALSLIRDDITEPILVMNGDVLTRLAFGELIDFHLEHAARATLCVREHQFQAPHGVAELDGVRLTSLREKPTFRWQANAGIYCLDGSLLSLIPAEGPYDMPELLSGLAAAGERVCGYPMHEYWLDIGQPPDFAVAQSEFVTVFPA